jgi:DNA polymerase-3 subunit gamma/tau
LVAEVVNQGRDPSRLSRDLVEHFRNLLVARLTAGSARLLDLPDQEIADLSEQAGGASVETLLDYFDFMAAGDEEIARSATPRFALETTLVRLASLPLSFPVAELVERLERLEQGKPKPFTRPAPPLSRTQEAAPSPRPEAPAAPIQSIASDGAGGVDRWRDFIAFVSKEKKFLASHLASSTALTLPPEPLNIAVAERHHWAFLQDSDNFAALKELAARFFAQDVAVQIAEAAGENSVKALDNNPQSPMDASGDRSPMVKEALRIFGGAIRNVRRDNG